MASPRSLFAFFYFLTVVECLQLGIELLLGVGVFIGPPKIGGNGKYGDGILETLLDCADECTVGVEPVSLFALFPHSVQLRLDGSIEVDSSSLLDFFVEFIDDLLIGAGDEA